MIAQRWKDLWYLAWAPVLAANFHRHRLFNGHDPENLKLNIGCGRAQFSGWLNIDGNFTHRPDMWLDVRRGLPFRNQSVKFVYSCHFIEHLYLHELRGLLAESRRVLREDGALRLAVPNLRTAIDAYLAGDSNWFSTFPAEFESMGGRFFNDMLCGDQHRLIFDYTFLKEILTDLGFKNVIQVARGQSPFLAETDEALIHERSTDGGKSPDPWLLVEATP